jgi:hypothetical protein
MEANLRSPSGFKKRAGCGLPFLLGGEPGPPVGHLIGYAAGTVHVGSSVSAARSTPVRAHAWSIRLSYAAAWLPPRPMSSSCTRAPFQNCGARIFVAVPLAPSWLHELRRTQRETQPRGFLIGAVVAGPHNGGRVDRQPCADSSLGYDDLAVQPDVTDKS